VRHATVGVLSLMVVLAPWPAAGQHLTIGPQVALADYREVASGLRYNGTGFGAAATARRDQLSVEASVVRFTFDPSSGSTATQGFTATRVDAWVAYAVAAYASIEVGVLHRSVDPEFDAQAVGAVRVGARSFYDLGPGATVSFRADYLAAAKFSGGGHATVSLDLGLGLDVRLAGRLHGTAAYAFDRMNRKTKPGGTGVQELDAPIQETTARVGLALGF
jgi:hypothetical protein